ncbi:MAG TPA: hypothetical protein DEF78_06330 [Sphingobacterium sp.]|nr:hypothetical protein [Sphingobacterium sp.]
MKLTTTQIDFQQMVNQQLAEIDNQFLEQLITLCDERIEEQRAKVSPEGYNDQTGQLRSSVGYLIYRDGKIRHENFKLSPYGTDKAPGLKAGRELALRQLRITEGRGLVMVAGMEYASWLEANYHRTVLTTATFKLEDDIEYILKNISV